MTDHGLVALSPYFTEDELLGLDIIRRFRNTSDYDDPTRTLAVQQLQGVTSARRYTKQSPPAFLTEYRPGSNK